MCPVTRPATHAGKRTASGERHAALQCTPHSRKRALVSGLTRTTHTAANALRQPTCRRFGPRAAQCRVPPRHSLSPAMSEQCALQSLYTPLQGRGSACPSSRPLWSTIARSQDPLPAVLHQRSPRLDAAATTILPNARSQHSRRLPCNAMPHRATTSCTPTSTAAAGSTTT